MKICALSTLSLLCLAIGISASVHAATVWDGPIVTINIQGTDANPFVDVLSPTVGLTRGPASFLFNPLAGDAGPGPTTPTGTLWAFDTAIGNPGAAPFSAQNFAALNFTSFLDAVGGPVNPGPGGPGIPSVVLNNAGVLYLTDTDTYIDIQFTQWTNPLGGNAVAYERASVVPLPATAPLLAASLAVLMRRARLRRATGGGKAA